MKALNRKKLITTLLVGVPLLVASSMAQAHSSGYSGHNSGGSYHGPRYYATHDYYNGRHYRQDKRHKRHHKKQHRKHRRHQGHGNHNDYYYDDYYGYNDGRNDRKRGGRDRNRRGGH